MHNRQSPEFDTVQRSCENWKNSKVYKVYTLSLQREDQGSHTEYYFSYRLDFRLVYLIYISNQLLKIFIPSVSILILEIWSHGQHDMIGLVTLCLFTRLLHEQINPLLNIHSKQVGVILNWGIIAEVVVTKSRWGLVHVVEESREDLRRLLKVPTPLPHHFHTLFAHALFLVNEKSNYD